MNFQSLKGKFIVLDGPDGCGKSTQVKLLSELITNNNLETLTVRDPGGTHISEQIRTILLANDNINMSVRCEMLLYMASRAQLYSEVIKPALEAQKCVICDRWVSSTYAYQAVGGRIGPQAVLEIAQAALERTWPDLTVIIDIPAETGLTRIGSSPDRMENKPLAFHQTVRAAFMNLAKTRADITTIDGTGTIEQNHQKIMQVIDKYDFTTNAITQNNV